MAEAKHTKEDEPSQDREEYDVLLARALSRPGVREVMEFYEQWHEQGQGVNVYRRITPVMPKDLAPGRPRIDQEPRK